MSPLTSGSSDDFKILSSKLTGILVGSLVNGEEGAQTGMNIASSAEINNRQLHQDEEEFIYNMIDDFKSKVTYKTASGKFDVNYTDEQAFKLLTTSAKYMIDQETQETYDDNSRYIGKNSFSQSKLNSAIEYLQTSSQGLTFIDTYKESMSPQSFFTSTKEQHEDSSWTPSSQIALSDQLIGPFIPVTRVGQVLGSTTKEISPVIIQSGKKSIDTINKIDNNIGSWISIKKDGIPLPTGVKKWTTDNIGYGDINDGINSSLPPATFWGTTYSIYDNWNIIKERVNQIFLDDQDNK